MQLEIINFEKFNPRVDRKKHSWFRLENDFMNDEKLFKLSPIEKFVWVSLLAFRSKKTEQIFDLDLEYLAEQLKIKETIISSAIQKLAISKALIIHEPVTSGNQLVSTGSPTYERTNVRTNMSEFDFETVYNFYPKKEGKTKGIEFCKSRIKTEEDYQLLLKAVNRYSKECRDERREKKFIKQFSSFMSVWRDYAYDDQSPALNQNRTPSGMPKELTLPDPRNGPMSKEMKSLLDKSLGRNNEGPDAA